MTDTLKATLAHWPELSQSVFVPHTERDYQRLVALLDQFVDEAGNDGSHPLDSLMEVVGLLIEKYEEQQVPELEASRDCAAAVVFLWGSTHSFQDFRSSVPTAEGPLAATRSMLHTPQEIHVVTPDFIIRRVTRGENF